MPGSPPRRAWINLRRPSVVCPSPSQKWRHELSLQARGRGFAPLHIFVQNCCSSFFFLFLFFDEQLKITDMSGRTMPLTAKGILGSTFIKKEAIEMTYSNILLLGT